MGAVAAPAIGVTLGDPAGIGPEIVARCWQQRGEFGLPPFVAIGDPASIAAVWDGPVRPVERLGDVPATFDEALPIVAIPAEQADTPGQPSPAGARCALQSLEMGVGLARTGSTAAVVTGPVSKAQLYGIGFTHPGQTEFVAERCGVSKANVAMMLAGPSLRCVPVTTHIPLAEAAAALSTDLVAARARATLRGLIRNFGIERPRLAISGLNPHAGENGALGSEEIEVIIPAIERLREEGWDVIGPLPADTMFHERARANYDAALCMYHDQALIPLKALHFDEGVNMTLGLPIVRTSPDHGTAFDIAGKGIAEPSAMAHAIRTAHLAARSRDAQGDPAVQDITAPA
ncbi:4-hydroxythreonine-4-phosphate dehydrogenase PdxA [Sphingomicrobium aestuariivivum]|uniref:4-hydroxythreonine-4-phosphate dehydrogenase PdxA n=1 Tax=Sphingomicrobium aestuariivivum TaxID=1582356 RepID=UPI001FD6FFF9|nr:4-hydroxythreonine-4-phosphate dehydrogenase PdxA [Sphingomicrobium aestuariivivum]MCJ8190038.1 4-hydroxythreonine-4-phosphate dehydrogenase PdxA [Sphingomicrobium aestuariivivum]